jgi:hypothetical protein
MRSFFRLAGCALGSVMATPSISPDRSCSAACSAPAPPLEIPEAITSARFGSMATRVLPSGPLLPYFSFST